MGYAYIGSFNYQGTEGIHICDYDKQTGTLQYKKTVAQHVNASHVCVNKDVLLATDEQDMGYVYAFQINRETGDLTEIDCTDTLSVNPSCITMDSTGKYAIITHFAVGDIVKTVVCQRDGSFINKMISHDSVTCLYKLEENGTLGKLCDIGWHHDGLNPRTMVHKAFQQPSSNLFAENDLEGNRTYFFHLNYEKEKLEYQTSISVGKDRDGARVGVFHPTLPYIYINYQNRDVIAQFDVRDITKIELVEEINLLPDKELFLEGDNQSEIMFHPEKQILYDFVRGKGYALVYTVHEQTGRLSLIQKLNLTGKDPRGAVFTPDGRFIMIAGHESNAVYLLSVKEDGTLEEMTENIVMRHPASIAFHISD